MKAKIPWKKCARDWWYCLFRGGVDVNIEVWEAAGKWRPKVTFRLKPTKTARAASLVALNFLKRIGWKPEVKP